MTIKPLADRVVIKLVAAEEKTKSGLILTASAQEKPQVAEVVAVGPAGVLNGNEINLKEDKCSHFMGITKNNKLGFIPIQCWMIKGKNQARKINFKDILGEEYEQNCN